MHLGRFDEEARHQLAPFLEIAGFAEIHHVVLDGFPVHDQRVALRLFDAAVQLHAVAAAGPQEQRFRLRDARLEQRFLSFADMDAGYLLVLGLVSKQMRPGSARPAAVVSLKFFGGTLESLLRLGCAR